MRKSTGFGACDGIMPCIWLTAGHVKVACRPTSDTNHTQCVGAKSSVDDLTLGRGVVIS